MAFDAQVQPTLANMNSALPVLLTTTIDPQILRVLFAPVRATEIFPEVQKGDWLQNTIIFPIIEHNGEVTSYDDYATGGPVDTNMAFPQRQNYLFQVFIEYGIREAAMAGLAGINYASEKEMAAADIIARFQNQCYFYGVQGLQNYGLLNDPALPASITPATKVAGGTGWFTVGGAPNATANEVYNDVLALYTQLVNQTQGLVNMDDDMVLAISPGSAVGLAFVNTFGLEAGKVIKDHFPNLKVVTAQQYGLKTAGNNLGMAGGNFMQLIARTVGGQSVGYMAYSDKMRQFPLVTYESYMRKKISGGNWGAIIRVPYCVASMLGI